MSRTAISISSRAIGPDQPPFIVAEMSGNHNGDIERAFAIMEAAKANGAEAVKLQTYTADTITIDHDGPPFRVEGGLWHGSTLYELYKTAHTPWDWHEALFAKGRELGLIVFSSPFDHTAVELLEKLDAPAYKIASFEIVDLPLIERAASTGKPLIISTGMATLGEISEAIEAAQRAGCREIALLHCTSGYPTPPEESNLKTISHLAEGFGVVTGLSDHTLGIAVPVAAVALGASIIEKHFTLRRQDGGPDAAFSLEPDELSSLAASCLTAWKALGRVTYERQLSEGGNLMFRRSLYVVREMLAGEAFSPDNLRSIRPGYGLHTKFYKLLLGKKVTKDIKRGTPVSWDLIV